MSITSRINEMSSHIEQAYDELQGLGADLTNVNKNIENISMVLDDIYDSLPSVSGEGTSLTLEDTRVGKIKSTLKGNTSQFTTTGKNLFNIEGRYETGTGIEYTKNSDGSYTLNGTANGNNFLRGLCYLNEQHTLSYTSNVSNSNVILRTRTGTPSAQTGIQDQLAVSSTSGNLTSSKQFDFVEISIVSGTTLNDFKIYIQLEKGSSVTSFEPYTGGQASPNPDFPQEVHVVKGDNKITVCSKNLVNANFSSNTINGVTQIGVNNVITLNGANNKAHSFDFPNTITYEPNTTYTTHVKIIGGSFTPYKQDSNWAIQLYNLAGTSNITLTSNNYNSVFQYSFNKKTTTKPRIWFGWEGTSRQGTDGVFNNLQIQIMVVKGAYSLSNYPTFEPYDGNIYDINLPVENKFDDSTTTNILIADDGTEQANNAIKTSIYIKVEPNTLYTCSSKLLPNKTSGWLKFSYYDASKNYLSYLYTDNTFRTITTPNNCGYIRIGYLTSVVNDVQFEKGSKTNSYTPFGTTPIELGLIGTYKDKFIRTSGKNLLENTFQSQTANGITFTRNEDGSLSFSGTATQAHSITGRFTKELTLKKGITYIFSLGNKQAGYGVYLQKTGNVNVWYLGVSATNSSLTITPTEDTTIQQLAIHFPSGNTVNGTIYPMLEVGSSATDYEPYGSGEWYLHKEIGKVVLNGSEYWNLQSINSHGIANFTRDINDYNNVGQNLAICNYFSPQTTLIANETNPGFYLNLNKSLFIRIDSNVASTVEAFKAWLSSHNVVVYYVLATPVNTEVEYQPLIDQLNLLEKAMSKDGQTNISQVNNDLPFIISASALKEWQESTSLNSTLSMVNPLSLGNTLNTQEIENNIQPIEVDNIEPLEEEENEES